jgi:hypothetical protein
VPRTRVLTIGGAIALGALVGVGCGDDASVEAGDQRAGQVFDAASAAGLPADVAGVLALAARGATSTYQVTYAGTEGARLVVSQEPPDRRVDVIAAGEVLESRVLRDGVAYRCERGAGADGALECERAAGALDAPGAFTEAALAEFTDRLASSLDGLELTVEERTLAGSDATCLLTQPKTGTTIDLEGPGPETLCLSPEGAQLLVDAGGDRLVAEAYTTDVPEGTFDI